jgi:hypothetical protein
MQVVAQRLSWTDIRYRRSFIEGPKQQASAETAGPDGWKRAKGAVWGADGSDTFYNPSVPSDCTYLTCGSTSIIMLRGSTVLRLSMVTGAVAWRTNLPCRAICWASGRAQRHLMAWIDVGSHIRGLATGNQKQKPSQPIALNSLQHCSGCEQWSCFGAEGAAAAAREVERQHLWRSCLVMGFRPQRHEPHSNSKTLMFRFRCFGSEDGYFITDPAYQGSDF